MIPVLNRPTYLSAALLIGSILAFSNAAKTAEVNPLRPVDTASPRETLQDFVVTMDGIYRGLESILQEYAASGRLYLTSDERRRQVEVLSAAAKAIKVLDLSDIPPVLQQTVAAERAIQLKEILDRIELPSFESVPDRSAAAGLPSKRWRLPETEIDIALVESGPRSGEYLFSAGTVDRLPEFYERVKKLPYKPGPAADLSDVYHKLSAGGTATIYDAYLSSPVGLARIVPVRWMLACRPGPNPRSPGSVRGSGSGSWSGSPSAWDLSTEYTA
jgi:MscS family membrane protein